VPVTSSVLVTSLVLGATLVPITSSVPGRSIGAGYSEACIKIIQHFPSLGIVHNAFLEAPPVSESVLVTSSVLHAPTS